jgi:ribosomal protein S13
MIDEYKVEKILNLLEDMKLQRLSHEEIAFIRELINKQKEENEIRVSIKKKITVGGVWAILSGIVAGVGFLLKHWLESSF